MTSEKIDSTKFDSELLVEIIELTEGENKSLNHELLQTEITLFRTKENLKRKYYPKYVKSISKKFFQDYYKLD